MVRRTGAISPCPCESFTYKRSTHFIDMEEDGVSYLIEGHGRNLDACLVAEAEVAVHLFTGRTEGGAGFKPLPNNMEWTR